MTSPTWATLDDYPPDVQARFRADYRAALDRLSAAADALAAGLATWPLDLLLERSATMTTGHMLVTPMQETSRRPDGERWCFRCRQRRPFAYVVESPIVTAWCDLDAPRGEDGEGVVEWSTGAWYGPTPSIRCDACGLVDGDLFPGTWREWEE